MWAKTCVVYTSDLNNRRKYKWEAKLYFWGENLCGSPSNIPIKLWAVCLYIYLQDGERERGYTFYRETPVMSGQRIFQCPSLTLSTAAKEKVRVWSSVLIASYTQGGDAKDRPKSSGAHNLFVNSCTTLCEMPWPEYLWRVSAVGVRGAAAPDMTGISPYFFLFYLFFYIYFPRISISLYVEMDVFFFFCWAMTKDSSEWIPYSEWCHLIQVEWNRIDIPRKKKRDGSFGHRTSAAAAITRHIQHECI